MVIVYVSINALQQTQEVKIDKIYSKKVTEHNILFSHIILWMDHYAAQSVFDELKLFVVHKETVW